MKPPGRVFLFARSFLITDSEETNQDGRVAGCEAHLLPKIHWKYTYRSQMQLGSDVAVAVAQAGGYSFNSTPSLGPSMCCRRGPKKDTINKYIKSRMKNQIITLKRKNTYVWNYLHRKFSKN